MEIKMSWFNTEGNRPYHAIYTQTKYIRNLSSLAFVSPDAKQLDTEMQRIEKIMVENGFKRENIPDGVCSQALSLAEKGFVGVDFCKSESSRALYLNEPCNLAVSIGEGELITIRSLLSGLAVTESKNIAAGAEELLDSEFEFAYSERHGYLSSNPRLSGSGAEFSALLYLPAISKSNKAEQIKETCDALGARLHQAFMHVDNAGHLYRLSYVPSHASSEESEAATFSSLAEKIIECERSLERIIFSGQNKIITDRAMRAVGILSYATIIGEDELLSLLSDIRLPLALGIELVDFKIDCVKLDEILAECLNASVIAGSSLPCTSIGECNALRAEKLKNILSDTKK